MMPLLLTFIWEKIIFNVARNLWDLVSDGLRQFARLVSV